jgi:ADP-ribosylglycohydrolase
MKTFEYNDEYYQKTYAGWLGKVIGVRIGSPFEGWLNEEIIKTYGEINRYVKSYNDYAADDDTNGPLFFIRSLIDFIKKGDNIDINDMAETWLNYVIDGRGFFWWGGYGISTEHTAYNNLKAGVSAIECGTIKRNGLTVAEQIGGQIFIDSWGFVFPGTPKRAASFAEKMIRISHDGEALYGGIFIVACISAAYIATTINEIIDMGLSVIPKESGYAKLINDIIRFYNKDLKKDWHDGFKYIQENYGYDKYPGNCHIIPNAAIVILSLLYGEGDYSKSQLICNTCGWDTDCNAGNIGSILGVFIGVKGIDNYWVEPIKDVVLASSCIGYLNIDTISNSAQRFADLGCHFAKKPLPQKWKENKKNDDLVFQFDMIKSTQGFRINNNEIIENSSHEIRKGHRSLFISNKKASIIDTFMKTYYGPEDLEDSRYDPGFSPIVFPGQKIQFIIDNPNSNPVYGVIYIEDKLTNKIIFLSKYVYLEKGISTLSSKIEIKKNYLISKIGIKIINKQNIDGIDIFIDSLTIQGGPSYKINFENYKVENYGFSSGKIHTEIQGCTYSNGYWELNKKVLTGSCSDKGEFLFGYYPSKDYTYEVSIKPELGSTHLINFRLQGLARSYLFGFYKENQIVLLKKHIDNKILLAKNFNFEKGNWYKLKVEVIKNKISCYVNDELIFNYYDIDNPYTFGQQGLTLLNSSKCSFKEIVISKI